MECSEHNVVEEVFKVSPIIMDIIYMLYTSIMDTVCCDQCMQGGVRTYWCALFGVGVQSRRTDQG